MIISYILLISYFSLLGPFESTQLPKRATLIDDEAQEHVTGEDIQQIENDISVSRAASSGRKENFKPPFLRAVWKEPTTRIRRVSYLIWLPSGVTNAEIDVCNDGGSFELSVKWPEFILDLSKVFRFFLRNTGHIASMSSDSPRFTAFEDSLAEFLPRGTNDVRSSSIIDLPFSVQPVYVAKELLAYRECKASILFVEFRSNDVNAFSISDPSANVLLS